MLEQCHGDRQSVRGSHHRLLIGFVDVGVVLPGGLGVGVPHHLSCPVVLLQKRLCVELICILVWVNKEKDKLAEMQNYNAWIVIRTCKHLRRFIFSSRRLPQTEKKAVLFCLCACRENFGTDADTFYQGKRNRLHHCTASNPSCTVTICLLHWNLILTLLRDCKKYSFIIFTTQL